MQTVIEMPEFIRCAKKLDLSDSERESIINLIASDSESGDEIPGTGGMRKVRVPGKGKGKSGGYRVITFFSGPYIPAFLITMYEKGQKANIAVAEKKVMKDLSSDIVNVYGRKKR